MNAGFFQFESETYIPPLGLSSEIHPFVTIL